MLLHARRLFFSLPMLNLPLTILESYNIVISTWQEYNVHIGEFNAMGTPVKNTNLFFGDFHMKLVQVVSIAALMSVSAASSAW